MDEELKIIPEPKPNTRTVFMTQTLPVFQGVGRINQLCGNCKAKLTYKMNPKQINNIVIRCPICKFYNEIP